MLFSVVIPVYNTSPVFLQACLNSVAVHKNLEVLIIDDGSTDKETIRICDDYDKQFDFIKTIHRSNGGPSDARNAGIAEASGEYIIFLDSDDWWEGNFLMKSQEIIKKSHPDIIICEAQKIEYTTGYIVHIGKKLIEIKQWHNGADALKDLLVLDNGYEWYAWRYLIRKDFLINNELSFAKGIFYEDVELIPRMIYRANKVFAIPGAFVQYCYHNPMSILNTPSVKKSRDKLAVVKRNVEFAEKIAESDLKKLFLQNISQLFLSAYGDYNNGAALSIDEIKENVSILRYNKSTYGKFVCRLTEIFGINLGTRLVKLAGVVIKLRSKTVKR